MSNTNRRIETIIVPRVGTTSAAAASLLYNNTTGVINLPTGAFGVYTDNATPTSSILEAAAANMTANSSGTLTPRFKVIQHMDTTNPRTPLLPKSFIESDWITPNCTLTVRGTAARIANNDVWRVGEPTGTGTGEVQVLDETEYIVYSTIDGRRTDMLFGLSENLTMGRFTTPNYFTSTVYTTTSKQRDHLLQNVAFDFNANNQGTVVCLAIDATATTSTGTYVTLTAAAALAVGSSIIVGYANDASAITLTVTTELKNTITLLIASGIAGTAQIIAYARDTAANIAAGNNLAGYGNTQVDMLLFITMDMRQAAYDEIMQRKERARIGIDGGFNATTTQRQLAYNEGSGYADDLLQWYRDTVAMRQYPGGKPWQGNFVEYPNEIVAGAIYDIYIIQHCSQNNTMLNTPKFDPKMTVIAIMNTNTIGFTGYAAGTNAQKTYIETRLFSAGKWFATTGQPYTAINL